MSSASTHATFSLEVTLGYGVDRKTEAALNKACCVDVPQSNTTNANATSKSLTELASQYFFPSTTASAKETSTKTSAKKSASASSTQNINSETTTRTDPIIISQEEAFFVASASDVKLTMDEVVASAQEMSLWKAATSSITATSGASASSSASTTAANANATNQIAVFVPPHIMGACLERHFAVSVDSPDNSSDNNSENKKKSSIVSSQRGSSFWVNPPIDAQRFAQDLLPRILPSELLMTATTINSTGANEQQPLRPLFVMKGIILTSLAANSPADLVLLEVTTTTNANNALHDLLQRANGASIASDRTCILKILPVTRVQFVNGDDSEAAAASAGSNRRSSSPRKQHPHDNSSKSSSSKPLLPTCPVCIHRIDPIRLGLPAPTNQHICSRFCPSPIGSWGTGTASSSSSLFANDDFCQKQKFLNPWPAPARCKPCEVIQEYWDYHKVNRNRHRNNDTLDQDGDLFCEECSMHKTLWTCLTCGFVGCGRYSNKHSVAHFEQTRHPYSLELATLRVWDYCHGEYGGFVQRPDLLECPSSPPLAHPWMIRGLEMDGSSASANQNSLVSNDDSPSLGGASARMPEIEKSSKKVGMIGDEYEALLQSALEDQAQHYEGEIAKLRAELTAALVDKNTLSPEEAKEIDDLKADVAKAKKEIEVASKELVEAQAEEAGLRKKSQELLSEQQKSNELLKKIQAEHQRENEQGKLQIEDLEQQVADLSANLRMRQQFSQSDELSQAQIFGTTSTPEVKPSGNRRGKKKGRLFRK